MAELFEPKILERLKEETASLNAKKSKKALDDPIGRDSGLMEFIEQAFAQTFLKKLDLEITSFTQASKDEVVIATREAELAAPLQELVDLYVDICNMWPDVLSQAYGGSSADFFEFRTQAVPETLGALKALSEAYDDKELTDALKTAKKNYDDAVTHGWKPDS
jgi:hypothetical protein